MFPDNDPETEAAETSPADEAEESAPEPETKRAPAKKAAPAKKKAAPSDESPRITAPKRSLWGQFWDAMDDELFGPAPWERS